MHLKTVTLKIWKYKLLFLVALKLDYTKNIYKNKIIQNYKNQAGKYEN